MTWFRSEGDVFGSLAILQDLRHRDREAGHLRDVGLDDAQYLLFVPHTLFQSPHSGDDGLYPVPHGGADSLVRMPGRQVPEIGKRVDDAGTRHRLVPTRDRRVEALGNFLPQALLSSQPRLQRLHRETLGAPPESLSLPLRQIIRQFPQIVKETAGVGRAAALLQPPTDTFEVVPQLLANLVTGFRGWRRGAVRGRPGLCGDFGCGAGFAAGAGGRAGPSMGSGASRSCTSGAASGWPEAVLSSEPASGFVAASSCGPVSSGVADSGFEGGSIPADTSAASSGSRSASGTSSTSGAISGSGSVSVIGSRPGQPEGAGARSSGRRAVSSSAVSSCFGSNSGPGSGRRCLRGAGRFPTGSRSPASSSIVTGSSYRERSAPSPGVPSRGDAALRGGPARRREGSCSSTSSWSAGA